MDPDDRIELVRDVLDQQLVTCDGTRIGKVDDVVLKVRDDGAVEPAFVECGGVAAARRLERPLRAIIEWMARRWGLRHGESYLIGWDRVRRTGPDVMVDVDPDDTPAREWERRVWRRVVSRIPGA